jgi:hypothetical protein
MAYLAAAFVGITRIGCCARRPSKVQMSYCAKQGHLFALLLQTVGACACAALGRCLALPQS